MIRLTAYLLAVTVAVILTREAAIWAWTAYDSPIVLTDGPVSALPPAIDGSGASGAKVAELNQQPLTAFPQTSARPLFFEGRRYPPREPPKKTAQAQEERAPTVNVRELKLLGVRVEAGISQALIAVGSQPPAWVNVGDAVMAWTVTSVDLNDVMLKREGQTADLKLYEP
jgi:hypothetical protein